MPLFTAENAAEMAKRSWQARKQADEQLRIAANPVPLPADNSYVERRLARVREQIEILSTMLDEEQDPNKLDRLANSISRMSELERQLAGRPLPGSLKPSSPKQGRRTYSEPTPQAVVVEPGHNSGTCAVPKPK